MAPASASDGHLHDPRGRAACGSWMPRPTERRGIVVEPQAPSGGVAWRRETPADGRGGRGGGHQLHTPPAANSGTRLSTNSAPGSSAAIDLSVLHVPPIVVGRNEPCTSAVANRFTAWWPAHAI